jgi:hypothetical protein
MNQEEQKRENEKCDKRELFYSNIRKFVLAQLSSSMLSTNKLPTNQELYANTSIGWSG